MIRITLLISYYLHFVIYVSFLAVIILFLAAVQLNSCGLYICSHRWVSFGKPEFDFFNTGELVKEFLYNPSANVFQQFRGNSHFIFYHLMYFGIVDGVGNFICLAALLISTFSFRSMRYSSAKIFCFSVIWAHLAFAGFEYKKRSHAGDSYFYFIYFLFFLS